MTGSQKTSHSGPTDICFWDAEMDVCLVPFLTPFSVYVDWPAAAFARLVGCRLGLLLASCRAGWLTSRLASWLADRQAEFKSQHIILKLNRLNPEISSLGTEIHFRIILVPEGHGISFFSRCPEPHVELYRDLGNN